MTGPCRKKVELEVWNNGWSLQVPRDQESQGRLAVWGQSVSSEQRLGVQTSGFRPVLVYHDLIVPSNPEILKLNSNKRNKIGLMLEVQYGPEPTCLPILGHSLCEV